MLYILKKMLQQTHIWVHYFPFSCEYLRFAKMENTHMHRLKILQYCKVKGEREVNPIYLSMKVKVKQLVAHSCPTLRDPMGYSPPDSSVHEIFQGRIPEWVVISSSRGSSRPRDQICVFCTDRQSLYSAPSSPLKNAFKSPCCHGRLA